MWLKIDAKITTMAISTRGRSPSVTSGITYSELKEVYDNETFLVESSYYSCMEVKCPDDNDDPRLTIQPLLTAGMTCGFT